MREMKNSGVEWLGEIPNDWRVIANKYLMRKVKNIREHYSGEDVLSLTMNGVIVRDLENPSGKIPATFDGYQFVEKDNLLMCLFDIDVTPRCIGLIKNNGVCSPAYSQFELQDGADANYYYYYYLNLDNSKELLHLAKNLRHSLTEEQLGFVPTAFPSLDEQRKVASILDKKLPIVTRLIDNEEEQIEKLKQYKQSLITEVVTKGLNSNTEMKDSGVEWIGEIPKDWTIWRTKFLANKMYKGAGITKDDVVLDGDTSCVRYGEIYTRYNHSFSNCVSRTNKDKISVLQYFSYGDILFVGTGELPEEIGKNVVYLGNERCLAGGDIIVLNHSQNPSYLNYVLNSRYSQAQKSCSKAKLKVVHISQTDIGNIYVPIAPIEEQNLIAGYLDEQCVKIDKLIEIKQSKIAKLNEYKKSLIYEYVTGKKEVV